MQSAWALLSVAAAAAAAAWLRILLEFTPSNRNGNAAHAQLNQKPQQQPPADSL